MIRIRKRGLAACAAGTLTLAAGAACGAAMAPGEEVKEIRFDRAALHEQAVRESLKPIRPGVPGKVPFWNMKGRAFLWAPALDFQPVKGAKAYRFTATAASGRDLSFEADEPWADLSPIWKDMPVGKVVLKVEGLSGKGGEALGLAKIDGKQAREFRRKAVFNGPYHEAATRIAGTYKKTQLENGTWHLLMEGKTGEKTERSKTHVLSFHAIELFERLAKYGMKDYLPAAGKELYLAKAVAFANAMTAIQKESGGDFVGTYWRPDKRDGGWPNCHAYSAKILVRFGEFLRARKLRVTEPRL